MERFDPVAAWFGGITSVWGRLAVFFAAAFVSHALGCAFAHREVDGEWFATFSGVAVWTVPAGWFWQVLENFLFPAGLVYLPLMLVLLMFTVFSERSLGNIAVLVFISQLWDSFLIQRHFAERPRWTDFLTLDVPQFDDSGLVAVILMTAGVLLCRVVPFLPGLVRAMDAGGSAR